MGQPSKAPLEGAPDIPQVVEIVHRYRDKPKPDPPADPPAPISKNTPTIKVCTKPSQVVTKPSRLPALEAKKRRKLRHDRGDQMISLGQRIAMIRRARHLSQQQLADNTGVTRREVQFWEAGERDARRRLPEIAVALKVTEITLLDIGGSIPPPQPKVGGG
jgi:DNA-binding XRE family transcriptional regulator